MNARLSSRIADIARRILGEPNRGLSTPSQLRFGRNGSVAVEIAGPKEGEWFDHESNLGGGPREFIREKGGIAEDEIADWLEREIGIQQPNGHDRSRRIGATYDYRDEQGKLLFQVVRFAPKDFRQRRPDGVGGWIWSTKDVRKVLYRLPELIAAPVESRVFIVEGEKDADRLAALGFVATTNPQGAAKPKPNGEPSKPKWKSEYNQFFAGRDVCIIPDNDDAGRSHARAIEANLTAVAAHVTIVELPGLADKGDVSDWLDAGGSGAELEALAKDAPLPTADGEISQADIDLERIRLRAALDARMARFNRDYAVVNESGKVWVFNPRRDPILRRQIIDRIAFADFKKLYSNDRLTLITSGPKPTQITKTAADWWLDHPERRQYLGGVIFDPTDSSPANYWNLWGGFSVTPAPGDWSLMQAHIRNVLCCGNAGHYEYLTNLVARLFQYPAEPAEVAVVMRGDEGVGKGIFARFIIRAFGQHGIQISSVAHLVGNFNAHLRDCVVLFADEAFYAGDKAHEGRLKALITEEWLTIEAKYQNVISVKNMLHVFMASNADWVVPASLQARRWFVLDVPDSVRGNLAYFKAIADQMEGGGLAAMIHDLLRRDISTFDPRAVPLTDALAEQQIHSLDSIHQWWLAVLERGFLWRSRHGVPMFREWSEFYATELLFRSYSQWCDEVKSYRRQNREEVGKFMSKVYPSYRPRGIHPVYEIDVIDIDQTQKHGDWLNEHGVVSRERPPGYDVGELNLARMRFSEIEGIRIDIVNDKDDYLDRVDGWSARGGQGEKPITH